MSGIAVSRQQGHSTLSLSDWVPLKLPLQELAFCSILCCKRKVQRCLSANRLSFSELFDDISLVLNVRRLCVVVDSLISAAKVCDCAISAWC